MIKIIVAHDSARGIGKNNELPWHLSEELKFVSLTTQKTLDPNKTNALIMGRKTYESIPVQRRPLKGRKNVVISSNFKDQNVSVFPSINDAINKLKKDLSIEDIYIFGGMSIYQQSLDLDAVDQILATEISHEFECDTFFPGIPSNFRIISSETVEGLSFPIMRKIYEKCLSK